MTKDDLRIHMRQKRRELTSDFIKDSSNSIKDAVIPFLKESKCVMVYMSAFNEPNTSGIIKYLTDNNIKIVTPVSRTSDCTIIPTYINSLDTLKKGAYGISEPETISIASMNDIDTVLVPGIVFSQNGERIGFGKGYYDKLLSEYKGLKIGICYDFQVIEKAPTSPQDIKMDMIITEKRIYNDI